jgi:hypothetical protein
MLNFRNFDSNSVFITCSVHELADGFPQLAAFLDSDDGFMIYRRFGFLHTRILLWKQDELREIEQSLEQMDREDARGDEDARRCLKSREDDICRTDRQGRSKRHELLQNGEKIIKEYGECHCCFMNSTATHNLVTQERKSQVPSHLVPYSSPVSAKRRAYHHGLY